jgi:hypothetical protein
MAPAGACDRRPAEPPHRRQGRAPRRLICPARRMTEWRLPPPGSAAAGRAGQPRLFPRIWYRASDALAAAGRRDPMQRYEQARQNADGTTRKTTVRYAQGEDCFGWLDGHKRTFGAFRAGTASSPEGSSVRAVSCSQAARRVRVLGRRGSHSSPNRASVRNYGNVHRVSAVRAPPTAPGRGFDSVRVQGRAR